MLTQKSNSKFLSVVKCKKRIHPLPASGFHSEFIKAALWERSGGGGISVLM